MVNLLLTWTLLYREFLITWDGPDNLLRYYLKAIHSQISTAKMSVAVYKHSFTFMPASEGINALTNSQSSVTILV